MKENFHDMLIVSVHKKMFMNSAIQLGLCMYYFFWKEMLQENIHVCTKISEIHEHFLL